MPLFGVDSVELYLLTGVWYSVVFASVIGSLCVRATRLYFAVLTLAFSMVLHALVIDGAVDLNPGPFPADAARAGLDPGRA